MYTRAFFIMVMVALTAPALAGGKDVVRDYFEASFRYDIPTLQGLLADDFRGLPPAADVGVEMDGMSRAEYFKTLEYAQKGKDEDPTQYEIKKIEKDGDAWLVTVIQTTEHEGEVVRQRSVSRATLDGDEISTLQLMELETL